MNARTRAKEYEAKVTRDGKWWMIAVSEIDGLTQARRLSEVELMARELIAVTLDLPTEAIIVRVRYDAIGKVTDVSSILSEISKEREQAAALERAASTRSVALAKALADSDIPLRDVGAVLGVSFQRAHQLVSS